MGRKRGPCLNPKWATRRPPKGRHARVAPLWGSKRGPVCRPIPWCRISSINCISLPTRSMNNLIPQPSWQRARSTYLICSPGPGPVTKAPPGKGRDAGYHLTPPPPLFYAAILPQSPTESQSHRAASAYASAQHVSMHPTPSDHPLVNPSHKSPCSS